MTMIIGSLMRPAPVFVTAAILLAVSIVSFYLFIKINRRNKVIYDKKLADYNRAVEQLKQQEAKKAEAQKPKPAPAPVEKKPVPVVKRPENDPANSPRRIQFMAPNGSSFDVPMIDTLSIGSSKKCDLVLDNESVAEVHCMIIYKDGVYSIKDMGSGAGTFYDGDPVPENPPMEVKTGVLKVGKMTLFMTIG